MNSYPFYQRLLGLNKLILVGHVAVPDGRDVWRFAAPTPPQVFLMTDELTAPHFTNDEITYHRVRTVLEDMFIADVEVKTL